MVAKKAAATKDGNTTKANGDTSVDATHDEGGAPSTVLAEVQNPEKLTNADINDITAGGLKKDVDGPRSDAAENLAETRAEARSDDEPVRPYLHGYGPGADI